MSPELISVILTAAFGLITTVGVFYQVRDIRNRPHAERQPSTVVPPEAAESQPRPRPTPPPPSTGGGPIARQPPWPVEPPHWQPGSDRRPPGTPSNVPQPEIAGSFQYGASGDTMAGKAQPVTPKTIRWVRVLILAITVLMIPNASFYVIGSITAGDQAQDPFAGLAEWLATICTILLIAVPLVATPTVLSIQIGRGRNWARFVTVVIFSGVGLFCGCFGAFFPFLEFRPDTEPSPVAKAGIAVFTVVISALLLAVAILLIRPEANAFFRAHKQNGAAAPR